MRTPPRSPYAPPPLERARRLLRIVSDSHDRAPQLAAAAAEAKQEGALAVIHCGDVIGAMTLRPLLARGLPTHVVHGNNLDDAAAMWNLASSSGGLVLYHGQDADLRLGGRRIFATHYPRYKQAIACTGDYDILCCGLLHETSVVRQPNVRGGETWLGNPGTVAGLGAPATWILADLERLEFEIRPLGEPTLQGNSVGEVFRMP